jgi:hypothetical protein
LLLTQVKTSVVIVAMFKQEHDMATTQQQFAPEYTTERALSNEARIARYWSKREQFTKPRSLMQSLAVLDGLIERYNQSRSASASVPYSKESDHVA